MPAISDELSERELEILRLVATGVSNKEIAQKLCISPNTVKVHLRNIFGKIEVSSRTEAAMYAVNSGLVTATPSAQDLDEVVMKEQGLTVVDLPARRNFGWSRLALFFIISFAIIFLSGLFYLGRLNKPAAGALPSSQSTNWKSIAPLPVARQGLALVSYEDNIYAIAGETSQGVSNLMESYNPTSNTWESLPTKPNAVTDVSAAVIGGKIYVPGGRLESGKPTNLLEIFDPSTNTWTNGAVLPQPISAYALVAFEGELYLFGGWNGQVYSSSVYKYDPGKDEWVSGSSLAKARAYAGATVASGKVFIMGGYDGEHPLSLCEIYQPDLDNGKVNPWSKCLSLPEPSYGMGVTSIADYVYVIGGKRDHNVKSGYSLVYLVSSREWQQIQDPFSQSWENLGLVSMGPEIYAIGGQVDQSPTNQSWSFQAVYLIMLPLVR